MEEEEEEEDEEEDEDVSTCTLNFLDLSSMYTCIINILCICLAKPFLSTCTYTAP